MYSEPPVKRTLENSSHSRRGSQPSRRRPHSALAGCTPHEVYRGDIPANRRADRTAGRLAAAVALCFAPDVDRGTAGRALQPGDRFRRGPTTSAGRHAEAGRLKFAETPLPRVARVTVLRGKRNQRDGRAVERVESIELPKNAALEARLTPRISRLPGSTCCTYGYSKVVGPVHPAVADGTGCSRC